MDLCSVRFDAGAEAGFQSSVALEHSKKFWTQPITALSCKCMKREKRQHGLNPINSGPSDSAKVKRMTLGGIAWIAQYALQIGGHRNGYGFTPGFAPATPR
jgi:hypothetical protein